MTASTVTITMSRTQGHRFSKIKFSSRGWFVLDSSSLGPSIGISSFLLLVVLLGGPPFESLP